MSSINGCRKSKHHPEPRIWYLELSFSSDSVCHCHVSFLFNNFWIHAISTHFARGIGMFYTSLSDKIPERPATEGACHFPLHSTCGVSAIIRRQRIQTATQPLPIGNQVWWLLCSQDPVTILLHICATKRLQPRTKSHGVSHHVDVWWEEMFGVKFLFTQLKKKEQKPAHFTVGDLPYLQVNCSTRISHCPTPSPGSYKFFILPAPELTCLCHAELHSALKEWACRYLELPSVPTGKILFRRPKL